MAQTGYTPILIYSSSTAAAAPAAGSLTNSTLGSELAINITDGKLFYKDNANAIQVIGWKTVPTTAGGTGLTSYTAGDLIYYASGTTFTKLAIGASGRWLGSSGTAPQWNAPAALTETDDTNVTLTLGGNPSTALLNAVSMTLGWTGQLAVGRGGTGLSTLATGRIPYGAGASAFNSSANLVYDGSNFGIGTGSPVTLKSNVTLQVLGYAKLGSANDNGLLSLGDTASTGANVGVWRGAGGAFGTAGNKLCFGGYDGITFSTGNADIASQTQRFEVFTSGGVSIGNTTDPGATNLSVTGRTVSALFRTSSGQIVPASGVTTTIFTCPTLDNGCYIVTCNIPGQAPPTYSAVGLVRVGGTTLNFTSLAAATTLTISVNGQNIRVVQNSGGTNAVDWTVTRIS